MFNQTIHTEIEINAPAERVWRVLTDLAAYRDWNPMIRRAGGDIREGARLTIQFQPRGTKGRIFRPKLTVVKPYRELRWQGRPGIPLIIESEHAFIISPIGGNSVRLDHDMVFSGLVIPLIRSIAARSTEGPFNDMNRALKERSEHNGA